MSMDIHQLLQFARERGASDLHLSAGSAPVVRIDGVLQRLRLPELSDGEVRALVEPLLAPGQKARLESGREVDFSSEVEEGVRYRINIFRQLRGSAAVFRVIPAEIRGLEELGLPGVLRSFCERDGGLVLVTGPTGSGKSTTLAAMVDYINETTQRHIITIEDPVEFIHRNKRCLVNQREVGQHTESFQEALRVAMREDPDVIVVGEMRDLETVSLALTAAETGHLVLSTLHTGGAGKTIDRIVDIFPEGSKAQVRTMLSESLVGIASQKLLPRREGRGRVLAIEMLVANTAVRNLIREDKVYQLPSVMQAGAQAGMCTLDMALEELMQKGAISRDEALKVAQDPARFR